jgi:putative transcriptional regulator
MGDGLFSVGVAPVDMAGSEGPRSDLAGEIAGEIVLSESPGATLKKWREEFDVTQTDLAAELDVGSSVVSDYESGRRGNPGVGFVRRAVAALLDIDEDRGGQHIRQYARVLSAGFAGDAVRDIREYPTTVALEEFYAAIGATELTAGSRDRISGHTVIASLQAITQLSGEEFFRLYGQSTSRALLFTGVTRGESPLVALRVVNPTPDAVVLHGVDEDDLWEHATDLAAIDEYSLAVSNADTDDMLASLRALP